MIKKFIFFDISRALRRQFFPAMLIFLVFSGYFWLGDTIYKDYGIPFDEPYCRVLGILNYNYVLNRDPDQQLLTYPEKYYGPAFEMLLTYIEDRMPRHTIRDVYLMRHKVMFRLFFVSVAAFFLLCYQRFRSWKLALLGAIFLVVTPRIFAHSFYNTKDVAFLAVFTINMCTLAWYLRTPTWYRAIPHAIVCGVLIAIRVMGVLMPSWTLAIIAGMLLFGRHPLKKKYGIASSGLVFIGFCVGCAILCFPILWQSPFYQFKEAFKQMSHFPWLGTVLYAGQYIKATDLPWHYIPAWILLTTPIGYLLAFCVGGVAAIISVVRGMLRWRFTYEQTLDLLALWWVSAPILAVIILHSVVYDEWRHLFFIYPGMILLAVNAVDITVFWLKRCPSKQAYQIGIAALIGLLTLCVAPPAYFMWKYHPYQYVYFNRLIGKRLAAAAGRFERDYWGVSFRQSFEYILRQDPRQEIRVYTNNWMQNALILPENEQKRLVFVDALPQADYWVSNYRNIPGNSVRTPFYKITIDGLDINVVYKNYLSD